MIKEAEEGTLSIENIAKMREGEARRRGKVRGDAWQITACDEGDATLRGHDDRPNWVESGTCKRGGDPG